jgi:thioredoxin reductase (NADPH)
MAEALRTDVAIVGAGPVGLFAVFELGMLELAACVLDALPEAGGQCSALYPEKPIYDIPGLPRVAAQELIDRLLEQAAPFRPAWRLGSPVTRLDRLEAGGWRLTAADGGAVEAGAVIVAAGGGAFGPNRPPLPGIERFEGSSVHYFVRRREAFRGKRVVIGGGGDSAVDWALSLAELAERVYLVHRRPRFRAAPESVRRLHLEAAAGRVELVVPYQLAGVEGSDGRLEAVAVATLDGETRRLPADALLPFYGLAAELGPIARWGLDLERGCVKVAADSCATNVERIFAVGDVASYPGKLKLILCGFAEAAMAAHAIRRALRPETPLHFEYSTTKGVPGRT